MSQKPETKFRKKLRDELDEIENAWFESIQQKAIQGTPDIIGCVNGYFVGIEVKATPRSLPTALQALKIRRITEANGVAFVVHPENMEPTLEVIKHIAKRGKDDHFNLGSD